MMEDIQSTYCTRKSSRVNVGACVIGLFPEDGVLYRAQVLEDCYPKYRVFYVDYGNIATVDEVYPIERKFMNLPAQAVLCGLKDLIPVEDTWGDPDTYSKFFNKPSFTCSFITKENDK